MPQTFITVEVVAGDHKTAEDWGLDHRSFKRRRKIKSISVFTFRAAVKDFTADPVFAEDDHLIIRTGVLKDGDGDLVPNSGIVRFRGIVTEIPRDSDPENESLDYEVSDPWYWLENTVFQQQTLAWNGSAFAPYDTSHILIPYQRGPSAWTVLSAEAQIREACRWVIEEITPPCPMQIGTIEIDPDSYDGGTVPLDEERDVLCSQVVTKMLRWAPDAVPWIDHTTGPPTLHCRRWSTLPSVSLALFNGVTVSSAITPLYRLQLPGVLLRFEQMNVVTVDGNEKSTLSLSEQKYPPATTGRELGCLIQTIDLVGSRGVVSSADIAVLPIKADSATAAEKVLWWQQRVNWMQDPRVSDIVISEVTSESDDDLGLPNELDECQIPPWLEYDAAANPDGVKSERVVFKARVTYKKWKDDAKTVLEFDTTATSTPNYITVEINSTNAITKLYSVGETIQQQELEPPGLARFIYDGLGILHYQGAITITRAEIAEEVNLGQRINLTGGRIEWQTMNAMVVAITDDFGTGTTTVEFGPPSFLGAQEMIDFLRTNRFRTRNMSPNLPQTGQASGANNIDLGKHLPRRNATTSPGGGGGAPPVYA
jgi:hypothetical protein